VNLWQNPLMISSILAASLCDSAKGKKELARSEAHWSLADAV
jgi:hypothetical protein